MALWPVFPVREDIITKNGDKWTEPGTYIGNGPFKLTEWVHQDHITFQPNPNYWGPKPKLTKISLKMITDINTELAAYKNGELDLSNVPAGTEKTVMAGPQLSKEIMRYPELGKQYAFNPTRAKQLLAEASYPNGKGLSPIKFQYANVGGNPVIAQFLQGQMRTNLGITVELEPMEPRAFSQMVNEEKHTWAWFGWGADYPDPDNWLPQVFGSGVGLNHALYSNPKFDALPRKALAEPDYNKRIALWQEAQKLAMDDAPIVTMFYRERFRLQKPYVKGLKTTGMDGQVAGDFFWTEVTIEKH